MLKKTITYTDYNGLERTEDFYFNLTKTEILEMQLTTEGGLQEILTGIINAKDQPALVRYFKDLILKSYGEKSLDGRRFVKGEDVSKAFSETEAYAQLFWELSTDHDAAAVFVQGIIPAELTETAANADNANLLPMNK